MAFLACASTIMGHRFLRAADKKGKREKQKNRKTAKEKKRKIEKEKKRTRENNSKKPHYFSKSNTRPDAAAVLPMLGYPSHVQVGKKKEQLDNGNNAKTPKQQSVTDATELPTDGPTIKAGYRVACRRLKNNKTQVDARG